MAGVFAFLYLNYSGVSTRTTYRPDGYIKRVNGLIETGRLVYHPGTDEADGNGWGRIEFLETPNHLPPQTVKIQNVFFEESRRLQRDIERYNESGEGVFHIRHSRNRETGKVEARIRLDESSYNFRLPYPERKSMDIKISAGGDELPTLAGDGIALGFMPIDEEGAAPDPGDILSLPLGKWFTPKPGDGGYHQKLGYNLLGDESGSAIQLRAGKTGTVLRVFGQERFLLFINGFSLKNPAAGEEMDFVRERIENLPDNTFRLAEGDRIRVIDRARSETDPAREMIFRFGRFDGTSLMQSWIENGKLVSQVDPEFARALPFLQQLVDATNAYGSEKNVPSPKVDLTVNQTLHSILQTKLDTYLRNFDSHLSQTPHTEFEPAAITVIDALSGDVLAIPSYPSPDDLEKLTRQFQTGQAPNHIGESKIKGLQWNQNFPAVPIGSTIKPILATAIWDTHPHLRTLTLMEPAGSIRQIYGHTLANTLATGGSTRTLDPVSFLGLSSNTYTVSLYFLTLADRASYSLNRDGTVTAPSGKVDFSRHFRGDLIPNGLDETLPAHAKLAECFDIDLNTDYLSGPSARVDSKFIAPLLRQLRLGEDEPVPSAFWPVTSARTVFNLQEIDSVRGELVSFLIGGSTNRWSNLKLAEAYARIGSGTKVRGRLLREGKDEDADGFDRLPVDPKALDLVHEGMTASWRGGTSKGMRSAVERAMSELSSRGLRLHVLAKTGTARRARHECAAVGFYAEIRDSRGTPLSALATTIYLQDRAEGTDARNSAVAVALASNILPDLIDWMRKTPAVQEALR
jgi:cell division protein FtsI/penicillin-binding protein 2